MKVGTYSLRVLFLAFTVIAGSLAALLRPTDFAASSLGLVVSVAVVAAIAIAFGTNKSTRAACVAFVVCCLLILYQNDEERKVLKALPPFNHVVADWLNERFGWAEAKGPNTWVYWSRGSRIYYEAFDTDGRRRSGGGMSRRNAQRLRIKVDLDNLPEGPPVHASQTALRQIVALVAALGGGLLAALLAQAASRRSAHEAVERRG